jgi:phenylalanyl-tRNA synthetase beta chain
MSRCSRSGTYENDTPEGQRRVAGGIRRGTAGLTGGGRHWDGAGEPVGVFDAKADAIAALEACGAPGRQSADRARRAWLVSSRAGPA